MKIKKYIASTLKEGKTLIIEDLGSDAIILSNRTFTDKDGITKYEIVAAMDQAPNKSKQEKKPITQKQSIAGNETPKIKYPRAESAQDFDLTAKILSEINNINQKIENISDSMRYKFTGKQNKAGEILYKELRDTGFSESTAMTVIGKLTERNITTPDEFLSSATDILTEKIDIVPPFQKEEKRQVLCFTGPTGSGKTLTLIKLAVVAKLAMGADTFLISADTHKVGGSDQLQIYSTIAGIPFESAYTPGEIENILAREKSRDFIFLDTVGRNPRNQRQISGLLPYIDAAKPDITFYLCSAVNSQQNITRSIEDFSELGISSIILTKMDETYEPGIVIEAMKKVNYPISYISAGQQIPDDIFPAELDYLKNHIFEEKFKKSFTKKFAHIAGEAE